MDSPRFMDKRQLLAICICFCLMVLIATLTLGVQPVYVVRLGADAATTGIYLAFNFLCVTIGNVAGGWLSDRFGQRKRITLIGYLLWIPASLLMTQATTVGTIILTSGLMWLVGGIPIGALNGIIGLSAGANERGRVFGWVGMAGGLGGLIAGLIGGRIAEEWGFNSLFVLMAILASVMFLITLYIRNVTSMPVEPQPQHESKDAIVVTGSVGSLVYLLLIANLIARLGPTTSDLGRPLVMLQLGLDATGVSNAIAFSAAVTLPLPLIMGWLSDRIGRKFLLIACFGAGSLGVLLLIVASVPWHFWFSAALVSIVNASGGVGQAYIADLSEARLIGRSLSLYNSSNFIAAVIGLASAGYVMQAIGINATLVLGAALLFAGIVILLYVQPSARKMTSNVVKAA
ncbi:MAG: MFS transporter [Anaerolineae bacterium]